MSGLERDVMQFLDDTAPALLERYYESGSFTGARFEFLAGGADRSDVKDVRGQLRGIEPQEVPDLQACVAVAKQRFIRAGGELDD